MTKPTQPGGGKALFESHRVIFREGDPGGVAYLVEAGKVDIVKNADDGPVVVASIGKGSIFGEMALIDGHPRMASAIAAEDTVCTVIDAKRLEGRLDALAPNARECFEAMMAYVRSTLPWEERQKSRTLAAETKRDRRMRRLMPPPDTAVPKDYFDPILRILYMLLLDYVRRRLPQEVTITAAAIEQARLP